jgi:hypothetical protein
VRLSGVANIRAGPDIMTRYAGPASCPHATIWRSSCRKRDCAYCGPRWARDWARSMRINLEHYGGDVVLVTITAPGADRLPWDDEHCSHPHGGQHGGKRGCRVQQRAAREWSETASWRYQALRRAATAYAKYHAPCAPVMLERVWEPQKRGVPHLHLVYGAGSPGELAAVAELVTKLKAIVGDYDFGYVDARGDTTKGRRVVVRGQTLKLMRGAEAARYLSAYLTGRSRYKPSIRDNLRDPAMVALLETNRVSPKLGRRKLSLPLIYMSTRLTRETRVTMRWLRKARHLYAYLRGFVDEGPEWRDAEEAAITGLVCRRAYQRRGEADDDPPDTDEVIRLAQRVDKRIEDIPTGWDRHLQKEARLAFADRLAEQVANITPAPERRLDVAA